MKVIFEDGDEAFYDGERCHVIGHVKRVNDVDAVHVRKTNGDIVLTPTSVLLTFDSWLMGQCIELLRAYEQWEADLTTSEDDDILEMMSTTNYEKMIALQSQRNDIGKALAMRNSGKS